MMIPLLSRLRRRLVVASFLEEAARLVLVVLVVALLALFFGAWHPGRLAIGLVGSLLLAASVSFLRRPSLAEVAAKIDRAAGTHDRLSTALAFEQLPSPTPLQSAALAECRSALQSLEPARWTPLRLPRWLPALIATSLLLALALQWPRWNAAPPLPPDTATLAQAEKLEALANELARKEENETKKIAEALKASAQQLRDAATGTEAEKAALRELSALEAMIEAAQMAAQENPLQTLADELAQTPPGEAAAEALRSGDAQKAAEQLDALAKEEEQQQALEEALARAAAKMAGNSPLAEAVRQAANRAQQGQQSEAMQQLAEAVRQQQSSSSQAQKNQQELQRLAHQLAEMKAGDRSQGQNDGNQPGDGSAEGNGSGVAMVEAPNSKENATPAAGDGSGGEAGSERDEGTKPTALGDTGTPAAEEPGLQSQLSGLMAQGESLQSLIATRSGEATAQRRYQSIYEAALPAAEEALERENIPLGSRLYIKRYFESIRPNP